MTPKRPQTAPKRARSTPRVPRPDDLYRALLELRTVGECRKFLDDLCTPTELIGMKERWRVAQMVDRGVPYREINSLTGVSTATVTRVGRALTYGSGGYRLVLDRTAGSKGKRGKS